jgi:hypothetical protein
MGVVSIGGMQKIRVAMHSVKPKPMQMCYFKKLIVHVYIGAR